jgi:HSP20 family protein
MLTLRTSRNRISPWQEMDTLPERLERMFGSWAWPMAPTWSGADWTPAVDFEETEQEFLLTAELPGMTEKDVDVQVERDFLTLKGEKRSERDEERDENGRFHFFERSYGSFYRSFTLPTTVDGSKIRANFANGVLTVHLPKRRESTARKVNIGSE